MINIRSKFIIGLFIFSLPFASIASNSDENTNDEKRNKLGFGVYSSLNNYKVTRISNGVFVSLNKFRLIGLLDISNFDYDEPYSICGWQVQLDYSLLKDTRFNPYVGINFSHLRYAYGNGEHSSHEFPSYTWYNKFAYIISPVLGVEGKIYKGIALTTQIGLGMEFGRKEPKPINVVGFPDYSPHALFLGVGLKININEFIN